MKSGQIVRWCSPLSGPSTWVGVSGFDSGSCLSCLISELWAESLDYMWYILVSHWEVNIKSGQNVRWCLPLSGPSTWVGVSGFDSGSFLSLLIS